MAKPNTIDLNLNHRSPLPRRKKVGIGCVGSGFIMADCQLVAYREHGLNPVAITSRTRGNAEAVAERHDIKTVHDDVASLVCDPKVEVVDIAVPPDKQIDVIREATTLIKQGKSHVRGILAQKPLGADYDEAVEVVKLCKRAKVTLCVNQNMRYDHAVRACKTVLDRGYLGAPVLATIDMRAIPHWMPWQERQGWCTLRIMSIHHLDTFRYWFGDPQRIYASVRPDPRTAFKHTDGICLYILEYKNGLRAMACDDVWAGPAREGAGEDIGIAWRIEGEQGMARGTVGWPKYPAREPSTIDFTTTRDARDGVAQWHQPRWQEAWFPDAFIGPMAELLIAMEKGQPPSMSGEDNLKTMALVEAAYASAREHRALAVREVTHGKVRAV